MRTRVTLAAFAVAALAATPLANAQSAEFMLEAQAASTAAGSSIPAGSLGSLGAPAEPGEPAPEGTVEGDRSVGCDAVWVAESVNGGDDAGFVSELTPGFDSIGTLQFQNWFEADSSGGGEGNRWAWRTPIGTTVPIENATLTMVFEPGFEPWEDSIVRDEHDFFERRSETFGYPKYDWLELPDAEPQVTHEDGTTTVVYELGDMEANTAYGISIRGTSNEDLTGQRGTATLTGTYPVGSGTCTPVQGSIAGTPLGSLAGSLADLGS